MSNSEETRRAVYRSVLPHEPLPQQEIGLIHLQGALGPKKPTTSQDKKEEASSSSEHLVWSPNDLERALFRSLRNNYESLSLPHPVESVAVIDEHNLTKARLTYASPRHANQVVAAWRRKKLSPSQLFGDLIQEQQKQKEKEYPLQFGTHACQVTLITTFPLPSDQSICWSRSSPPKFRRLVARPGEENVHLLEEERAQTRFVVMTEMLDNPKVANDSFWNNASHVVEAIRSVVNRFDSSGLGAEVFVSHKKLNHSCHVGMRSAEDAKALIRGLQGQVCDWECCIDGVIQKETSGSLFLDYVGITKKSASRSNAREQGVDPVRGEPSRPECTSTTNQIQVPGLQVIEDFITEEQEEVLMAVLTGPQAPWAPDQKNMSKTGSVKRLVQHYGYVFDYETADVLRDRSIAGRSDCPPMPGVVVNAENEGESSGWDVLGKVVDMTRNYRFCPHGGVEKSYPRLNQLTLNHYKPGEGIGSHVDTPSAFGDGLLSISLNSGIVMEFRKVGSDTKKLVYLPRRSIVLMSGPARYEWEHMIVTRRTDTVDNQVKPRGLRVSLTLRTALDQDGAPLPLVESVDFPPVWGSTQQTSPCRSNDALTTPATERDHVHAVYDAIATQWHNTRGKRGVLWPGATQFLKRLPPGSMVADVGCGDGKYFPAVWEAGSYVIGTDISRPLLETSMIKYEEASIAASRKVSDHRKQLSNRPAVAVADCMSGKYKPFSPMLCFGRMKVYLHTAYY